MPEKKEAFVCQLVLEGMDGGYSKSYLCLLCFSFIISCG